uniref:Uncharacterized protein n=1 Tax=Rhizophora mucronata TaxID=61149 RepID=A0A2P2PRZ8_RHIMU
MEVDTSLLIQCYQSSGCLWILSLNAPPAKRHI